MEDFTKRLKYRMNGETLDGYCHIIDEEFEAIQAPNEVDLSSFRPQKELNDKVWVNGLINSRVRLRLLDIADDFIDTLGVSWVKPEDIILTGSLANYNWSRYSDFDVHILYDFKKINKKKDFVERYFNSLKNEWNNEHDAIKIYGFTVELYVEDVNDVHESSGVYSLEKNKWLVEPSSDSIKAIKLNKFYIKEKAYHFMKKIENLSKIVEMSGDDYVLSKVGESSKKILDKLKGLRKEGLKSDAKEMSSGNIIYKILRRTGHLDKLYDIKTASYDREKSLK